jgi:hypothetical protein
MTRLGRIEVLLNSTLAGTIVRTQEERYPKGSLGHEAVVEASEDQGETHKYIC